VTSMDMLTLLGTAIAVVIVGGGIYVFAFRGDTTPETPAAEPPRHGRSNF